jgi:hypothetical protein
MKRKSTYEYIALILLSLITGFILYRQTGVASVPVYATTLPPARSVDVPITPRERQIIRDYLGSFSYGKSPRPLPTGLGRATGATRQRLMSDWEKKLAKGQKLPSEIYRECSPMPKDLTLRLPPAPLGTVLVAIDGRVVRVGRMTFEILDVFDTRM